MVPFSAQETVGHHYRQSIKKKNGSKTEKIHMTVNIKTRKELQSHVVVKKVIKK